MKLHRLFATALLIAAPAASCGRHETDRAPSQDRVAVFVSIVPQAYFVERVGGKRVSVEVLVRPGQSPATYEPTPRQMAALGEADVFFRIGAPFESALLDRIGSAHPGLNIVDTREGVEMLTMGERGHRGDGDEGVKDPHIWLDPRRVRIQARTIRDELKRLLPRYAAEFDAGCDAFAADLDRVHAEIARALAPLRGKELLVFHPAFGYFADSFGLRQVAIEAGGRGPGARGLAELVEKAKAGGVKVIFVQPQFSSADARMIAREIGGAVVPMDPLARDYLANLEEMAEKVRAGLARGE